ncbi:MAG: hypothetical protein ACYCOU_01710 [Sulfobacillus sp.]
MRTPVPNAAEFPFRLVDIETGSEIPYQIEKSENTSPVLVFYAEKIPSLGYRMYSLEPGRPAVGTDRATVSGNTHGSAFVTGDVEWKSVIDRLLCVDGLLLDSIVKNPWSISICTDLQPKEFAEVVRPCVCTND